MLWPLIAISLATAESAAPYILESDASTPAAILTLDPASQSSIHLSTAAEGMMVGGAGIEPPHLKPAEPALPQLQDNSQRHELLSLQPDTDAKGSALAQIAQAIDVTSFDLPMFQADVVTLLAPTGTVQPFAAIAHQYDDLDDVGRYGVGAGTKWTINPYANFGTQLLFLPHDRGEMLDSDLLHNDMRLMTRLEVHF